MAVTDRRLIAGRARNELKLGDCTVYDAILYGQ